MRDFSTIFGGFWNDGRSWWTPGPHRHGPHPCGAPQPGHHPHSGHHGHHDHAEEGPARTSGRGHGHRPGGGRGGRGGPFGFGGGGGFPFGLGGFLRGPRARRGDVRAGILALLAEQPRNGYQLMQELEARSRGMWRPSPGAVYPALQQLEDEGLVRAEEAGSGRLYHLTDDGRKYVAEHAAETKAPWELHGSSQHEELADLMGLIHPIATALWQIASHGQPEQIAEARKALNQTRRALYTILSKDPEDEE